MRVFTRCDRKGHEHLSRALVVSFVFDTGAAIVVCTGRTRRHPCGREYLVLPEGS